MLVNGSGVGNENIIIIAPNYFKVKNFMQVRNLLTDRQPGKTERVDWDFHSNHLINYLCEDGQIT